MEVARVWVESARRQARREEGVGYPSAALQFRRDTRGPFCVWAVRRSMVILGEPEREMAPWKRSRERGEETRARTLVPPLDWPIMVTRDLSPPNA